MQIESSKHLIERKSSALERRNAAGKQSIKAKKKRNITITTNKTPNLAALQENRKKISNVIAVYSAERNSGREQLPPLSLIRDFIT